MNGQCRVQNLSNCEIFDTEIDSEIQICLKCNDGFFWNGNQCVIGNVLKCKKYATNVDNC